LYHIIESVFQFVIAFVSAFFMSATATQPVQTTKADRQPIQYEIQGFYIGQPEADARTLMASKSEVQGCGIREHAICSKHGGLEVYFGDNDLVNEVVYSWLSDDVQSDLQAIANKYTSLTADDFCQCYRVTLNGKNTLSVYPGTFGSSIRMDLKPQVAPRL
jgi:hypothetical protein